MRSAQKRKPWSTAVAQSSSSQDNNTLPLHRAPNVVTSAPPPPPPPPPVTCSQNRISQNRMRRRRRNRTDRSGSYKSRHLCSSFVALFRQYQASQMIQISIVFVVVLLLLLVILVGLDRLWVHHSLSFYPKYHHLAKATQPPVPLHQAKIVIASLHEGWKYHGLLGQFLRDNKQSYANQYGYAYIDSLPEGGFIPLQPWQMVDNRAVYYKKPRFLLYLMERYQTNVEWVLWMDGDAILTQPYVSVEDRIHEFQQRWLHDKNTTTNNNNQELCLAWAEDSQPNAGVLLIRNNPTGRELLRTALNTWEDTDVFQRFTDQASLTATVQQNKDFRDCSLLLRGDYATLLQSRVRGPPSWLWQPGHWILHFPNHNYLQLLSSLKMIGKRMKVSPSPMFPPLERPFLDQLSETRRDRFQAVQGAVRHAWKGYADVCLHSTNRIPKYLGSHIPCDDVSPEANLEHDWLYHAATVHDSLDTLAIALGTESDEYKEALSMVLAQDLQASSLRPTKTFEYSLRIVGGLLGAFSVTGDVRLLSRAKDAVDSLLQSPFASSPTVLPRMYDVLFPSRGGSILYQAYSRIYQWGRDAFTSEHHLNSLAGVGSFSLEFYFLSKTLGLDLYRQVADRITQHVVAYQGKDGTVPSSWNVMTGKPHFLGGGLGSGSDSFVEYLLKVPLFICTSSDDNDILACIQKHDSVLLDMLELYDKIVKGPLRSQHTVSKEFDVPIAYPVDNGIYHQLLCFVPGMLALGATISVDREDDLVLAEKLVRGCHDMHEQSSTGFGPEKIHINRAGAVNRNSAGGDPSYLLRPEYVESLFVLYRTTGKQEYQEMGWEVFESLERYCKIDLGYTGLRDVYDLKGGGRVDDMPSYFIAETLKYLLLLFGPDDFVSLQDFVFTTEAHPLLRVDVVDRMRAHAYIQAEISNDKYTVHAPFPWRLFGVILVVISFVSGIAGCIRKMWRWKYRYNTKNLTQ